MSAESIKKNMKTFFLSGFLILSLFVLKADPQVKNPVTMKVPDGVINFSENRLLITASGAPSINVKNLNSARIEAEQAAKKNLKIRVRKAFAKIIFAKGKSVEKYFEENKLQSALNDIFKKTVKGDLILRRDYSDGSVDLRYSVPMEKYLEQIRMKALNDLCICPEGEVFETESADDSSPDVLVVEIKDSKFTPPLFLTVESGENLVYSSCCSNGTKSEKGFLMVERKKDDHFFNVLKAKGTLRVSAKKVIDGSKVVITEKEMEKIKKGLKKGSLKQGRVIFIVK